MSNKNELNGTIAMLKTALASSRAEATRLRHKLEWRDRKLFALERGERSFRKLLGSLHWKRKGPKEATGVVCLRGETRRGAVRQGEVGRG